MPIERTGAPMTEEASGQHPRCPAQENGNRTYSLSEKQLYCLRRGWTHTSLYDQKGILQTIDEDNPLVSSAPQPADPTRYMSEEQRKYILSFKEEDPLLMAYAEGQKAAINEERAKALKKLTRIQFMVKHAWEGDRDTNPPDLGDILKFVEGFIAELRQQSGEQQRGQRE